MRELGSGTTYNTHNTTSLIRTLKHVSDILQTEEAFTVKEYTHTHTITKSEQTESINQNDNNGYIQFQNYKKTINKHSHILQINRYFEDVFTEPPMIVSEHPLI